MATGTTSHSTQNVATRLVASATELRWKGFPFDFVRSPAVGEFKDYLHPCDFVSIVLKGRSASRLRMGQRSHVFTCEPGTFVAYRRGDYWDHLAYNGSVDALNVRCDWNQVPGQPPAEAFDDMPPLSIVTCANDRAITAIASSIVLEAQAGCPSGRTYAEALSLALFARLCAISHTLASTRRPPRPMLAPAKMRLVLEYIDHCLAEDLSVAELAALVERSPAHFAEGFRNALGTTVHRYIVDRRLERSRRELSAGDKTIAQIAVDVGFSSQSHFIATFRRTSGITPSHFRRDATGGSIARASSRRRPDPA